MNSVGLKKFPVIEYPSSKMTDVVRRSVSPTEARNFYEGLYSMIFI